ncbi:MAG: 2-C-methyl-D-erythritol 4-phosphate cytidylyltransferase [Planctomycetota bacterium]
MLPRRAARPDAAQAEALGLEGTDEAALAEALGIPVVAVDGPATNLKLTCPEDLALAPCLLRLVEDLG